MKDFIKTKFLIIYISIFYTLGICAYYYNIDKITALIVFIASIICIIFFDVDYKKILALCLIFLFGIIRCEKSYNISDFLENVTAKNVIVTGRVVSNKNINQNKKARFFLKVQNIDINNKNYENVKSKILISVDNSPKINNIAQGDIISIKGRLKPPKESVNPYQFDYKKYLLNNDCKNIMYGNIETLKKLDNPKLSRDFNEDWYFILNKFEHTRNKILKEHSKNIKSPKLEILGGIVFGNETVNPDDKVKENFQNSGLLHLLAASGLNVALIYGIWQQIAILLRLPYRLCIFTGAIFVILYTFMTGFPPSILRASLMLLFVLFGKLINRDAKSESLIFFVGFLILLFNPKMLFDVGFQLSFTVTFGLIVCTNVILKKFENKNKNYIEKHKNDNFIKKHLFLIFSPLNIISAILIPTIAQAWVAPLQMHYFNNFAPLSILANIAIVPFIGILSFIGFISSIIALIPILNKYIVYIFDLIANPLLTLLLKISEYFSSFKYSLVTTIGLNVFQIIGFWIILLILTLNIKNNFNNKKEKIILISLIIIMLLSLVKYDNFTKNLEILMFDVENADCFLIKTPQNKYIMIDTAKKTYKGYSDAKIIINPYLKNKKIKKLDFLIITHFDMDHSGGSIDILENNKVDNIYIQKLNSNSIISEKLINYLKENNLNYKVAKNNETIYEENNLKIKLLRANFNENEDNENSIITLMSYKDKNFLFMGDGGIKCYEKIKNNLPDKINILKIGHHGAKNVINDAILNRLKPDLALISAGGEKFIHPHYTTVLLLKNHSIKTISTKNYNFTKIILKNNKKDFKYYHYNSNKMQPVMFDKTDYIPFHKSKDMENIIKNL